MTDTRLTSDTRRPAGSPRPTAAARAGAWRAVGTPLLALAAGLAASPAAAYDWDWHDPAALPLGFTATLDVPPATREALLRQAIGLDAPRRESASAPATPGSPVRLSPPDDGPGLAALARGLP